MATANIADLKNNLSRYLRRVRRGEEVLICDRKVPIARIVPLSLTDDFDAEELALAAAGRMRLPTKKLPDWFWTRRGKGRGIPLKRLVQAIEADLMKQVGDVGLRRMESLGQLVDPLRHEVLSIGPGKADTVVEVFEEGYELNGKVQRPAKVQAGDGIT